MNGPLSKIDYDEIEDGINQIKTLLNMNTTVLLKC
jgi:hypothetical protein